MGFAVPVLVTTGTSELSRTERIKVRVRVKLRNTPHFYLSHKGREDR